MTYSLPGVPSGPLAAPNPYGHRQQRPGSSDTRYNFALALKAADYPVDAANELKKILAGNPNDVRAHLALGNLYAQQLRDPAQARQHYLRVLAIDPGNSQAPDIQFWLSANPP